MEAEVLGEAARIPLTRAEKWADHITIAMDVYHIRQPRQQAAFIAQTCHESMQYQRTVENLNYSTAELIRKTWPYRFPSLSDAKQFVRKPSALANRVYANRNGNGDEFSGDGWLYRGRGLLQITGKANYRAAAIGMELPLLSTPEMLEEKEYAAASAAWWWDEYNLNEYADRDDIDSISGIINRGDPGKVAHGQDERRDLYMHALHVLDG